MKPGRDELEALHDDALSEARRENFATSRAAPPGVAPVLRGPSVRAGRAAWHAAAPLRSRTARRAPLSGRAQQLATLLS